MCRVQSDRVGRPKFVQTSTTFTELKSNEVSNQ